ncbi:MAG: Rieske 2Fe-2S domain-containing protein [Oceanospirillaceae bacterium]|nr:Rieske 2Fe-2S domain-containing protein [Oceanospirillaceae bacterium]
MLKLCTTNQLFLEKTNSVAITSVDHRFIIVSVKQEIFVYKNSCPHLHKALNTQGGNVLTQDGSFIRCSRHNALFTLDQGLCIRGPCNASKLSKQDFVVRNNEVSIKEKG